MAEGYDRCDGSDWGPDHHIAAWCTVPGTQHEPHYKLKEDVVIEEDVIKAYINQQLMEHFEKFAEDWLAKHLRDTQWQDEQDRVESFWGLADRRPRHDKVLIVPDRVGYVQSNDLRNHIPETRKYQWARHPITGVVCWMEIV